MSAMEFRARRGREAVHLSVTPLIDVLFLLIIFFMLTGTFKRFGELELRLPSSETATAADPGGSGGQLELVVTEAGGYALDGLAIDASELESRLRAAHAAAPDRPVMLEAEAGVRHGEIVQVLDILRNVGFPGVGLGTELAPKASVPDALDEPRNDGR